MQAEYRMWQQRMVKDKKELLEHKALRYGPLDEPFYRYERPLPTLHETSKKIPKKVDPSVSSSRSFIQLRRKAYKRSPL